MRQKLSAIRSLSRASARLAFTTCSSPIGLIDPPERSIDEILNLVAAARDIQQRHDENSFTTYRLPKPIYVADAFSADVCFLCGEPLLSNPGPNPN